jgi:hypothetical protein
LQDNLKADLDLQLFCWRGIVVYLVWIEFAYSGDLQEFYVPYKLRSIKLYSHASPFYINLVVNTISPLLVVELHLL